MFEAAVYSARRRLTARGYDYELAGDGEPALEWTLGPYWLADDLLLETPAGDAALRLTGESPSEYASAPFTVVDERDGAVVGLVRRNLRSLVRRTWGLLDPHGIEVATVDATSRLRSVARQRWLRLVPYRYAIRNPDGEPLGEVRSSAVPRRAFTLDLTADDSGALDPRLAIGASAVIDGFELR